MASIRPATRYTNSLNSSTRSDPSSSAEFATTHRQESRPGPKFVVAADLVAADLKKNAKKSSGLSGLHKKLFKGSTGSGAVVKRGDESSKKALTEVKSNTRTLAMVLRSERELLIMNKEQDELIAELKISLLEKNREVEKLKDLCLKQREEIKSLKSAILFPDVMNTQLQDLLEKQGSELKQAKQLIPNLQRQVTSLTGQLQSLADDIAEVKADKYSGRGLFDNNFSSPRTPSFDQDDAANSLFDQEYSSGDYTTPDSPDEMILKDLNPCLTPYYAKTKSKDFDVYNSPDDKVVYNTCATKLSKSSEHCQSSKGVKGFIRTISRSGDSKRTYGKQTEYKRF
ncbi:hypothetical protein PHJA_000191900 [Phtheirospermum japonicum]|uniref:Uncharacterized protein n=1 Tax=Phtheirospermum japonicum TaxID=374723 RepID=A0A830B8R3_9LAMI|nr:hypothetical protein PHJA_000191900 [Phtheirospermum japonicum]